MLSINRWLKDSTPYYTLSSESNGAGLGPFPFFHGSSSSDALKLKIGFMMSIISTESRITSMMSFRDFVTEQSKKANSKPKTRLFICHCYDEGEKKPFLMDVLEPGVNAVVMIGPEGDFGLDEVKFAQEHGFVSVSLGRSRLRTETAGLAAVHMMQIMNPK